MVAQGRIDSQSWDDRAIHRRNAGHPVENDDHGLTAALTSRALWPLAYSANATPIAGAENSILGNVSCGTTVITAWQAWH